MWEVLSAQEVVADNDLFAQYVTALGEAGVCSTRSALDERMRQVWLHDPGARDNLGFDLNYWAESLTENERLLLAAVTWPNPYLMPVREDVVIPDRSQGDWRWPANPDGSTPSDLNTWARIDDYEPERQRAAAVRLRVRGVFRWLSSVSDKGDDFSQKTATQWSCAVGLFLHGPSPEYLADLVSTTVPLVAEDLIMVLRLGGYSVMEIRGRTVWGHSKATEEKTGRDLERLQRTIADVQLLATSATTSDFHTYLAKLDPARFHAGLPAVPGLGTKYRPLFDKLDKYPLNEVTLTVTDFEELLDPLPTVGRGRRVDAVPQAAYQPAFWANRNPSDRPRSGPQGQEIGWRAAGFQVVKVEPHRPPPRPKRGSEEEMTSGSVRAARQRPEEGKIVTEVRFVALPGRSVWWEHRTALRTGTYQPADATTPLVEASASKRGGAPTAPGIRAPLVCE